jgi:RNA polymerase subunit RPABC4/transcription elongation factor Spt4
MATQWQCFRCDKIYGVKVEFCPDCGTPQMADPDPENMQDKSWIIVVVVTLVAGITIPFGLYFFF